MAPRKWPFGRKPARQPLDIGGLYDQVRRTNAAALPADCIPPPPADFIEPPSPAFEQWLERELENESQAEREEGRS